jgi:hypothetical protein
MPELPDLEVFRRPITSYRTALVFFQQAHLPQ